MSNAGRTDWFMFTIAAGLAVFGSVMVYSASAMMALKETQEQSDLTYFYKQFGFSLAGIAVMLLVSRFDYRLLQNKYVVYGLLATTAILLVAVLGFPAINGAKRWIRFGGFSFQPSEIAKVALPVFLAYFLTKRENEIGNIKRTVLPSLAILAVLSLLVFREPDLGTVIVLSAIFSIVFFSAGARLTHLAPVAAGLVVLGVGALVFAPWRLRRIVAFIDPCDPENAADTGYQVCQSLYAIGSGGVLGEGFAKGQQKLFYLPYPYSDFIFSVVGEELGLIGTLAVVLAFGLFLWRGARAVIQAPDRFGSLLGIGLVTGIVVQALFNLSVVTSILPAKGIPLPFISYGGSSVLVTMFAVGLLLSISRAAAGESRKVETDTVVRRRKGRSSQKRTMSAKA
jgi:cell division protein FtsW